MVLASGLLRRRPDGRGWRTSSSLLRRREQDEVAITSEMAAVSESTGFVAQPVEPYNSNPVEPRRNRWWASPPVAFQMDIL
jgi:hypothetical protein